MEIVSCTNMFRVPKMEVISISVSNMGTCLYVRNIMLQYFHFRHLKKWIDQQYQVKKVRSWWIFEPGVRLAKITITIIRIDATLWPAIFWLQDWFDIYQKYPGRLQHSRSGIHWIYISLVGSYSSGLVFFVLKLFDFRKSRRSCALRKSYPESTSGCNVCIGLPPTQ